MYIGVCVYFELISIGCKLVLFVWRPEELHLATHGCLSGRDVRPELASYISLGLVHVTLFLFLFVAHLAFSLISCITWFIRQESFFPDSLAMGTHFQECFWVSIRPWVRGQ